MFRMALPPKERILVSKLAPDIKRDIRSALDMIVQNPRIGEPLRWKLKGFHKYRVRQYRIVYEIIQDDKLVKIHGIGRRKTIYEDM